MSAMQKFAWFNLAVIAWTLVAVIALVPFLGKGALGCFGFLGFMGLSPLFFRKKPGRVLLDERDQQIQLRAFVLAYSVCWVVFVLAATFLSTAVYGQEGAVPVMVVQYSVWCGFMLMQAVGCIAILFQYAGGSKDGE